MTSTDEHRERTIATVRRAYGAFSQTRDPETEACFDADVMFTLHGDQSVIPHAGTYQGLEGIRAFALAFDTLLDCSGDGPLDYIVDDGSVVVRGYERSRVRSTGRSYETPWLHLITLRNHRIVAWEEYLDTERVAAAFLVSEQA